MITLNDILGHDDVIAQLRRAFAADRLPHALLFAGPRGVGKGTTATALSAAFLCQSPDRTGALPCEQCESCRVFAAGNHPDFHHVYRQLARIEKEASRARDLPVEVVRQFIVRPAALAAGMDNGKVFVVEEAETMNVAAQNALLKTLEEPIGRALIVLLTDSPDLLLPTIRSRCQVMRFGALDATLVVRELMKSGIAKADAEDAALFSDASLGLSRKWLAEGVIDRARELSQHIDALLAGKRLGPDLDAFFKKSADAYAEAHLKRDDRDSKDQVTKEGYSLYFKLAADHLRRQLEDLSDAEAIERSCSAIEALRDAEVNLDTNVNAPLTLQQLTVALEHELIPS